MTERRFNELKKGDVIAAKSGIEYRVLYTTLDLEQQKEAVLVRANGAPGPKRVARASDAHRWRVATVAPQRDEVAGALPISSGA